MSLLECLPHNRLPAGFTEGFVHVEGLEQLGFVCELAEEGAEHGAVFEGGVGALGEVGEHGVAGVAAVEWVSGGGCL